jgi:murein DD-endopeptidase MepM/ murein hydrolase activator NlpD
MKFIALIALTTLGLGSESFFDQPRVYRGATALDIQLSDTAVANGHTLLFECVPRSMDAVFDLRAARDTTALRLYTHPTEPSGAYFSLMGIPYYTERQSDTIHVEWTEMDRIYDRSLPFRIVRGPYRSETISGVPQNRVTPSAADYRRIARERKIIGQAYIAVRDSLLMDGTFSYPVEKQTITSAYGTRRVFNGQLRSYHGGLDLRAYEGTPIYAAQSGRIKLSQNLFYSGNHVVIEHGMGIHSSYSHMSKRYVKGGEWVEKGQRLGLSGSTGRVNAAHLHWTLNIHGVGVSPLQGFEILNKVFKTPNGAAIKEKS